MFTHYAIEKKQSGLKTIVDLMLEKNSRNCGCKQFLATDTVFFQDFGEEMVSKCRIPLFHSDVFDVLCTMTGLYMFISLSFSKIR